MYEQFSGYKLNSNFTMLPNITLQDSELSCKALGVLVRIMSFPKSWKFSFNTLLSKFSEGRDYIRGAINELIKSGYVVKKEIRVKGRFDAIYYRFYPYKHHQMKALQEIGILTYEDDWEVDDFDDNSTSAPETENPSMALDIDLPLTDLPLTASPETVMTTPYIKNIPFKKENFSSKERSEEILNFGEGEVKAVEAQTDLPANKTEIELESPDAFQELEDKTVPPRRSINADFANHKTKEIDPLFVSVAEQWGKTPKEVYEGFKGFVKQSVGSKVNNPEAYAVGTIKKAIADPQNNQLWQDYLKANKPPATEPHRMTLLAAVTEFKASYASNSNYAIQRVLDTFKQLGWTFDDFLAYARSKGFLVGFCV